MERSFTCLFAISLSSLVRGLFRSLADFLIGLFIVEFEEFFVYLDNKVPYQKWLVGQESHS